MSFADFSFNINNFGELLSSLGGLGMNSASLVKFFLGSFLVGVICVFSYYVLFHRNKFWTKSLKYPEKFIISFTVGLLSVLIGTFIVVLAHLLTLNFQIPKLFFSQLLMITPFVYFMIFAYLHSYHKKDNLLFLRHYIIYSALIFIALNYILFTLMIFYTHWGLGIVWLSITSLILLEVYKYKKEHE